MGGDEFAILQANLTDSAFAGVLASKILDALSAPIPFGDTEMYITASIGISCYGIEIQDPDEMLARADIALYRAKEEGRNQYRLHDDHLDPGSARTVRLPRIFRQAFQRNELQLYFQPQIELSTGRIAGMEAL